MFKNGTKRIKKKAQLGWQKRSSGRSAGTLEWQYQRNGTNMSQRKLLKTERARSCGVRIYVYIYTPDMIVIDKEKKHFQVIDFAVPYDGRIGRKNKKRPSERAEKELEMKVAVYNTNHRLSISSNNLEVKEKIKGP